MIKLRNRVIGIIIYLTLMAALLLLATFNTVRITHEKASEQRQAVRMLHETGTVTTPNE